MWIIQIHVAVFSAHILLGVMTRECVSGFTQKEVLLTLRAANSWSSWLFLPTNHCPGPDPSNRQQWAGRISEPESCPSCTSQLKSDGRNNNILAETHQWRWHAKENVTYLWMHVSNQQPRAQCCSDLLTSYLRHSGASKRISLCCWNLLTPSAH